ncbi:MAG: FAD-dependent oxidoreductase [Acidobacteriaceae bacterium]
MTPKRPVLVIGGGVIGVCCAYSLRRAGFPVMLAEAATTGSGASSGNLGVLAVSHSMPLASPGVVGQAIRWLFQPDSPFSLDLPPSFPMLRWLVQFFRASRSSHMARRAALLTHLSLESLELFQQWSRDLSFYRRCSGTLEVFRTDKAYDKFRRQLPAMQAAGIHVEMLSRDATRAFGPDLFGPLEAGAFYPADCVVDPLPFAQAVRGRLQTLGVEVREQARVLRCTAEGNAIRAVDFENGTVDVAAVVLATGFEINRLIEPLGMRLPVQAARGYTFDFPSPAGWPEMPVMFAEAKLLSTPFENRRRLGGYLRLMEPRHARAHRLSAEKLTEPLFDYIHASMVEQIRQTASPVWAGFRPCSPDGLPIIGRSMRYENLCFATGHGMLGVTLAPITAKLVVACLEGKQDAEEAGLLGPDRFS